MKNSTNFPDCFTIEISSFGKFGEGFGLYKQKPVFVLGAIPDEIVSVRPILTKRNYVLAQIAAIIKQSPYRVSAPCPYFGPCSGCQWQHIAYEYQLELKKQLVVEACKANKSVHIKAIASTLASPLVFGYRNHARFTVRNHGMIGFTNKDTKRFVPIDNCMLMDNWINETLSTLQHHCAETSQLSLRYGTYTGSYLVQPKLVSNRISIATGTKSYEERILNHAFRISSPSFFQVNTEQMIQMVNLISDYLQFEGDEVVVDAYAVVGTFAVLLSPNVKKMIAIEESASAIADATINIKGIPNIELRKGKTEHILKNLTEPLHTVILDPPRVGCERSVLETLVSIAPKTVVYVSCDPDSFARDLLILEDGGFVVDKIQPIDMFPQTRHVELVSFLTYKVTSSGENKL